MENLAETIADACEQRLQGVPVAKHKDALIEVDADDVVALCDRAGALVGKEAEVRDALRQGSAASAGRRVNVRPDQLLIVAVGAK